MNNFMIPLAIVIAGGLIAGGIFFGARGTTSNIASNTQPAQRTSQAAESISGIRPITSSDHILGNPNAPVKIVEYSDFECPFCKKFHTTMQQVMDEYGENGQVAWVYRHFPLDSLHPRNARRVAIASECAAELGGNDGFWGFTDRFFELTPSNDRTNIEVVIPQIIGEIGIDKTKFDECLLSGRYDEHIQEDVNDAIATGGRGTPWSVILSEDGSALPLSGAQPYASVKQLIEIALQ